MVVGDLNEQDSPVRLLIVDDDAGIVQLLLIALMQANYYVLTADDGESALKVLEDNEIDLIISDLMMPGISGFDLLQAVRSNPETKFIPFILLTARGQNESIIKGLDLGADDYLIKPVDLSFLKARIQAKTRKPTVPIYEAVHNYRDALVYDAFIKEIEKRIVLAGQGEKAGCLATIGFYEYHDVRAKFGGFFKKIARAVNTLIEFDGTPAEIVGIDDDEQHILMLIPDMTQEQASARLEKLAKRIMKHGFVIGHDSVHLTPIIGFTPLKTGVPAETHHREARLALDLSANQLDLVPKPFIPSQQPRETADFIRKARQLPGAAFLKRYGQTMLQIALTFVLGWGVPFFIYMLFDALGIDLAGVVYIAVVCSLLFTAALIWYEGYLALKKEDLPEIGAPYPPASMIVPAYLPNEASTIMSTLNACLQVDYPVPLQIILAYNTPKPLPIEIELEAMAQRYPNLTILNVHHSTSKAQNVNAALSEVTGDFVAIFDADHQPDPDTFKRAWAWLSNGFEVVQGHCLIRNGDFSRISRLVAVEFEAIYAVSHPGRARLHDFGIFGGSNGYWRTELLRETRMQGFMLTEDIDSSIRTIREGYKIKSDPHIISRELAPTIISALWTQRMRWAQGWYQVSLRHTLPGIVSSKLNIRQKFGLFQLLLWREIYPWLSMQVIPIVAFWLWSAGTDDLRAVNWFVPIFVVTSLVTMGTGPGQIFYILRLGDPSITKHKRWIVFYLLAGFFYTEYKNLIGRVAQFKEVMGERKWHTTPRA